MSFTRRIRNIAKTQISNLKDRLDRIDADADLDDRFKRDAERELNDPTDIRPHLRKPEEIAPPLRGPQETPRVAAAAHPLAKHYRILGVEEGTDLNTVESAYGKLLARCDPSRFPEGSDERRAAQGILQRVEDAYSALRDVLDPTAGRFDKLEL